MSQAVASPHPASAFRRFVGRVWSDPDTRSTTIGIGGVLLIHLLLFLLGPYLVRMESVAPIARSHRPRQFNIEISPESFAAPKQPPKRAEPKQFVETNPDAPENTPDKTNNFGAQNQQVAQQKVTPDSKRDSERPAMEGKKDFQSTQIVSGQLKKQPEHFEPAPQVETAQTPPSLAAPRAEQNPLPGFDKKEGDNPNAFGTNRAPVVDNPRAIPEKVEGEKNVPLIEGATAMQPAIDPKRPRPRPSIVKQQQVRPAILAENKVGTPNIGITAVNAKFSNYGQYLQRMVEAIQLQWDSILEASKTYPPQGTWVTIKFVINSEGRVVRFGDPEVHTSTFGVQACTSAIADRAPYGVWTEDMKAMLNPDGEELIFTFYYN